MKLENKDIPIEERVNGKELLEKQAKEENNKEGKLNEKDNIDCKICKNKGYIVKVIETAFDYPEIVVKDCKCMKKRNIYNTINKSSLKEQFKAQTFKTYIATSKYQQIILSKAKEYTSKVLEGQKVSLIYSGAVGSGKTHLAVAVCKTLIDKGKDFKYIRFNHDFGRLQKDMQNFNTDTKQRAEYELERLKNVEVLYIDDFLKNGKLDYVFDLIDARYTNDLITIITTETPMRKLMQLDQAIGSRLYEMTGGASNFWIDIKDTGNRNYRLKGVSI